jgi:hypothetical protein
VAGLLHAEHALEPRHDFVRRRVRGFVQVDDAVADVLLQRALQRGVAARNGGVVPGANL